MPMNFGTLDCTVRVHYTSLAPCRCQHDAFFRASGRACPLEATAVHATTSTQQDMLNSCCLSDSMTTSYQLCCVVCAEHVVLYDLDRKFDGIRLYHVLLTHLKNLPGEQQLRYTYSLIPCKHGTHLANDLQSCRQVSFIKHASHACRGL